MFSISAFLLHELCVLDNLLEISYSSLDSQCETWCSFSSTFWGNVVGSYDVCGQFVCFMRFFTKVLSKVVTHWDCLFVEVAWLPWMQRLLVEIILCVLVDVIFWGCSMLHEQAICWDFLTLLVEVTGYDCLWLLAEIVC